MAELLGKDHDNFDDADDEDLDLDRYDSAAGWDGSDAPEPNAKTNTDPASPTHKDRYAHRLLYLPHESMFEVRPANAAMRTAPPADLVPGLWRTGEVALLIGEPNIGKSLLAVQIAESIARGVPAWSPDFSRPASSHGSPPCLGGVAEGRGGSYEFRNQKVLLLDLDQTDAQFAERYTCPSPIPGKLPVRYRFSPKLIRPSYRDFGSIPAEFNDSLTKFFDASIDQAIAESGAKVIIIDNLAALTPYARNNSAHIRMLNSLKLTATTHNLSILVIAPGQNRLRKRADSLSSPPYLGGVAAGRGGSSAASANSQLSTFNSQLANIADSVMSLNPTTYGPEYRYIKLLKSKNSPPCLGGVAAGRGGSSVVGVSAALPTHAVSGVDPDVLVFQLDRISSPTNSPPCLGGVPAGRGGSSSSDSSLVPRHSSLEMASPFLGFEYLGPASESDLTRDYAAEQRAAEAQERSRIKKLQRSSREILVNGVLDGSYGRYLKGE
ncbi:MAG: AAA family ATPase [Chloracidobacterium sp.]|nr:AAA family ATPase [Chloracidobacterium sp.]